MKQRNIFRWNKNKLRSVKIQEEMKNTRKGKYINTLNEYWKPNTTTIMCFVVLNM